MLSVCMIAKNEAAWIGDCISHLKPVASEFIVVDTGSDDETKKIARAHCAKVVDCPWEEDFSKPRNKSLSLATQPWILTIDPDERIAERDLLNLKKILCEKTQIKAFAFQTRNYLPHETSMAIYKCEGEYLEEKTYTHFFLSSKIRLFQNFLGISWKGIVHETVNESVIAVCKPGEFEESDIVFHHYGVDPHIRESRKKHDLYYRLTEKKIQLEPRNPDAFIEYAKERIAAGEIDKALGAFRKAHELDPSSPFYRSQMENAFKRYQVMHKDLFFSE